MYWIVIANTNLYHLYSYDKQKHELSLLSREEDPDAKSKASDLVSDKPGHYQTSNAARGAYSPHTEPKENEIDHFLKKLADKLEDGRTHNQLNQIIFIAPPHVNGLLLKQLNKHVASIFLNSIKKDLTHLSDQELKKFIDDHWKELTAVV